MMPFLLLVVSFLFVGSSFFSANFTWLSNLFGITPKLFALYVGLTGVVLTKAGKYVFFDPTKEIAYIPLDEESKSRGKSAVDGLCSRMGKGSGSVLIGVIECIPFYGSVSNAKGTLCIMLILIVLAWLWAAGDLSNRFEALLLEQKQASKEDL